MMKMEEFFGRLFAFATGVLSLGCALIGGAVLGFYGGVTGAAIGFAIFFIGLLIKRKPRVRRVS